MNKETIINKLNTYKKYFKDDKFWDKVKYKGKQAGAKVLYMALLLYYVLKSPDVTIGDKAKIYGALGYFIMPVDLIPDYIPVVGYSDDLVALAYGLHAVWKNVTPDMKQQAKERILKLFGEYDESTLNDENLFV